MSLSRHKPANLTVFLSLSLSCPVSLIFLSFFSLCLCSVLLSKPWHLYFKDVFVSLLCIQMIRLTGRKMQLWRRVGWKRDGESPFGVMFLWTRSLWGDDSWRNAPLIPLTGVTWPLGSLTFESNLNSLGGQAREKCPSIMCVSYTVYAHYDFMSFRSGSICRNMGFVTAPWNQTVWLHVAFPSGQTRLHLPATMSTASDTFLSVC